MFINWICHTKSGSDLFLYTRNRLKSVFEYKITFWICVLVLWIHKGYCVVKKLVWNVPIKAFWYTKLFVLHQKLVLLIISSGKELFMTDNTLNDSDIKFLESTGDTAVTVDESLFEVNDRYRVDGPRVWEILKCFLMESFSLYIHIFSRS